MRRLRDVGVVASATGVRGQQERAGLLASRREPCKFCFCLHSQLNENKITGAIPTEVGHLVDLETL